MLICGGVQFNGKGLELTSCDLDVRVVIAEVHILDLDPFDAWKQRSKQVLLQGCLTGVSGKINDDYLHISIHTQEQPELFGLNLKGIATPF